MTHPTRGTAVSRRSFNLGAIALAASAGSPLALAQGAPVEGRDFLKLPAPVNVPSAGKIDVIEFFWYGCPHCYAFEPAIEAWIKKLPQDVAMRRVHVAFTPMHELHAKMFYAAEQTGTLESLHRKLFNAMHQQNMRFLKDAEILDFVKANGADAAKFGEAMRSFGVATKVQQAKQLVDAYKVDGVPGLGIHGRWYTSPSLAGSPARALAITDQLIDRARKG
jgi:protein dithiol oxidoreductase (disulfide-forming)